jgi:hypothetical protein
VRTITNLTITPAGVSPIVFDDANFILTSLKGLEMPKVRLPRFDLPGSSGAFISNALYSERGRFRQIWAGGSCYYSSATW